MSVNINSLIKVMVHQRITEKYFMLGTDRKKGRTLENLKKGIVKWISTLNTITIAQLGSGGRIELPNTD